MVSVWLFQDSLLLILMPRYYAVTTVVRMTPWSVYSDLTGLVLLVKVIALHLVGLSRVSRVRVSVKIRVRFKG